MTDNNYKGKRLLLIHNGGKKQGDLYCHVCDQLGITIDQLADKPNEKAFGKIAGRLHLRFYERELNKYYHHEIDKLGNNYDYILVIRGEYTPSESIQYLREKNPHAKMVLYMWDSIQNNRGIQGKWSLFDKVYSFDRADYLKYKDRIGFVPLFYCEEYIDQIERNCESEYDIAFIGTAHGDRVKIVKAIRKESERNGLKMFSFLYCPHILVFLYNKLFNKDYKYVKRHDLSFKPMTQKEIYEIYSRSDNILDIEIKTQTGLTMRTMDILGLKKKLITTNRDIVNYDFYDKNNILILDRDNVHLDLGFLKAPYNELSKEIYDKYSMKSWLLQLIS